MRENKCRAKAINRKEGFEYRTSYKNGDWVYGLLERHEFRWDDKSIPATMRNEYGISNIDVDERTSGQYICIEDKNNVEIYEGDIVRFNNQIGKVVFECGSFGIGFDDFINWKRLEWDHRASLIADSTLPCCYNDHFISFFEIYEMCDNYEDVEVIGNIYDNPELLKGDEK